MKLSAVLDELVSEKNLDRATISAIVCEGILAAYKKRYPDLDIQVTYQKKADEIAVTVLKSVVTQVTDEASQISIRKARATRDDIAVGEMLEVPFSEPIGRIEILKAKQIIAQKVRAVEAQNVYKAFKPKEGTIVHGVVYKIEYGGAIIKLGDVFGFLPKSLTIPGEKLPVGYTIRVLLKEVLEEPRHENQLILDRNSAEFLRRLLELEIPEVFEKIVEIKKIVRSPGYKSKIAVLSHDQHVDPVGTLVGVGGARIKPILKELGTEKVDIIEYSDSLPDYVKAALKPAVVNRVEIEDRAHARVWVDEDQRSFAIGKMGQNIALAAELTGVSIDIVKNEVIDLPVVDDDEQTQN